MEDAASTCILFIIQTNDYRMAKFSSSPLPRYFRQHIPDIINKLEKLQRSDGGFTCYAYPASGTVGVHNIYEHPSIFVTALIAQACAEIPGTETIRKRAVEYLLRHKSREWSWNYWERDANLSGHSKYPDDLDDTSCAIAAIYSYQPSLIDGKALGAIGKLLIASETKVGGPYRTWAVKPALYEKWGDADVAVNANIMNMLQLLDATPPNLKHYLGAKLSTGKLQSAYYTDDIATLYFLARIQEPQYEPMLRERLLKHLPYDSSRKPLTIALILAACTRAGVDPLITKELGYELSAHADNNHLYASEMYAEPSKHGVPYYAGADALTLAVAAEAMSLYLGAIQPTQSPEYENGHELMVRTTAYARVAQAVDDCSYYTELKQTYLSGLKRIEKMDAEGNISGLPTLFAKASNLNASHKLRSHLSSASIAGWLAYTLYDDVLDEDSEPAVLCAANVALRECERQFQLATTNKVRFMQIVRQTLTIVDDANHWEAKHARAEVTDGILQYKRLPNYGSYKQLADRSWGHSLAGVAILLNNGYTEDSSEVKAWQGFMRHYLIARQLNDDAHDWQEDLRKGHLSAVVVSLLRSTDMPTNFEVAGYMPALRQSFWEDTLDEICGIITDNIRLAETNLTRCTFLTDKSFADNMLEPLREAARQAQDGKRTATEFMATFYN